MLVALLPVLVLLIGLVMYLAGSGKAGAIGLAMFTGGVTGLCVAFAGRVLRLL